MNTGHATVVIGANFGDEGKGLAVDALAARAGPSRHAGLSRHSDAAVIRFNGGAQAGHTVVTEDGRRHVFSHVGAGAFAGAVTFLSRFFVVQPAIFAREAAELAETGLTPRVYIDPDARLRRRSTCSSINGWKTHGAARAMVRSASASGKPSNASSAATRSPCAISATTGPSSRS
jgi:hypothetical protein